MIKKLAGERIKELDNKSLMDYKRTLDRYRGELLKHVYDYMAEYQHVRTELRDRAQDLEIELICAEDDRLTAASAVAYTPDSVH